MQSVMSLFLNEMVRHDDLRRLQTDVKHEGHPPFSKRQVWVVEKMSDRSEIIHLLDHFSHGFFVPPLFGLNDSEGFFPSFFPLSQPLTKTCSTLHRFSVCVENRPHSFGRTHPCRAAGFAEFLGKKQHPLLGHT